MQLRDIIGARTALLRSPLAVHEVEARLAAVTDGMFVFFGRRPLIGSVGSGRASFRRRIGYRNSFQTVMWLRLEAFGKATDLHARSQMHPLVFVFMAVWFAIVVAVAAVLIPQALSGGPADEMGPAFALMPPAMLAFGVLLVVVGRWVARGEHARLIDIVAAATDAKVIRKDHD